MVGAQSVGAVEPTDQRWAGGAGGLADDGEEDDHAGRAVGTAAPPSSEDAKPGLARGGRMTARRTNASAVIAAALSLLLVAGLLVAGLLVAGMPGRAGAAEISYRAASTSQYLESFSRSMFGVQQDLDAWWARTFGADSGGGADISIPWWVGQAVNNFVTNLVNEPLTLISALIAGDMAVAAAASQRLAINTVIGLGGFVDLGAQLGLPRQHMDLGLALCAHGVPGGPYVFIPVIGPRTVRDLIMDYVVAYTLYVYIASLLTGPSPPIILFVLAKNALWLAELITIKQMDVEAAATVDPNDYDGVRQSYLRRRHQRCQEVRVGR